jgi:hypothetical protein
MGRPSKLTPEVQALVCDAIRHGNFREAAAKAAGVTPRTLHEWMRKGREADEGPYAAFLQAVHEAEAEAELNAVRRIYLAGADDVNHLKWWLERKFIGRWGRDARTIRELQARLAELEKRLGDAHGPLATPEAPGAPGPVPDCASDR